MKVDLQTRLALSPEDVWQRVLTPELLFHIAAPLVRFRFVRCAPPVQWSDGSRYLVAIQLFGLLPFGEQWIVPTLQSDPAGVWPRRLCDNGHSALIKTWDHRITIASDAQGGTLYRDEVEVHAGLLTLFIWVFAQIFYRHRQRRWRSLARGLL